MELNLSNFRFDDALLDDDQSLLSSLRMFLDFGFIQRFKIPRQVSLKVIYSSIIKNRLLLNILACKIVGIR